MERRLYIIVTLFFLVSNVQGQSLSLATAILSDRGVCQKTQHISSSYRVNDLELLKKIKNIFPKAYNIDRQVTGYATTKKNVVQAYVLDSNGSMILVPHSANGEMQSVGLGINIFGWIVGKTRKANGSSRAFMFVKEMKELIDIHPKEAINSEAVAINGLGEIVIRADSNSYLRKKDGTIVLLEGLGGETHASAINDDGLLVGLATDTLGVPHGFIWSEEEGLLSIGVGFVPHHISNTSEVFGTRAQRALKWSKDVGFTEVQESTVSLFDNNSLLYKLDTSYSDAQLGAVVTRNGVRPALLEKKCP